MISVTHIAEPVPPWEGFPVVEPLRARHAAEALAFLSGRPLHTVAMAGFIRENGVESPLNRGGFYGSRNALGQLEGVALIGHATLFEARTPRALRSMARVAQESKGLHMVLGEAAPVAEFWRQYRAGAHQPMRLACRELMFEFDDSAAAAGVVAEPATTPRLATLEDLPLVMPVQARMVEDESGVNPMASDPEVVRSRMDVR
jgi:hypothetical protein